MITNKYKIKHLLKLSKLRMLDLKGTAITDDGLEQISEALPQLTQLSIEGIDQLTDKGLLALKNHPSINHVTATKYQFSRKCLESISDRIEVMGPAASMPGRLVFDQIEIP